MWYISTRNEQIKCKAAEAVLNGIASDGGLFMPSDLNNLKFPLEKIKELDNFEISAIILNMLFNDGEYFKDYNEVLDLVKKAYQGKFTQDDYAKLVKVKDGFVLELYHGPTCAFKDVALQALPHLILKAKEVTNTNKKIVILTATSGDTGSAALSGFKDIEGTEIIVFYPNNSISQIQERQMVSCDGKNTHVISVKGNFDDTQSGVKYIFKNMITNDDTILSSANSINIGRLAPQIAYYFKAYRDLLLKKEIEYLDKVNFVVPTGNFGDILAGYFAKTMGLPINKLICASNKNNVLTDFFNTGIYNKNRPFYITNSPSMDILISSNLERLLYLVCGSKKCKKYMNDLNEKGYYKLDEAELNIIRETFEAGFTNDSDTLESINNLFSSTNYLIDTHTAVAWNVFEKWEKNESKTVVLSTASAYKFSKDILKALNIDYKDDFDALKKLNQYTNIEIPKGLIDIENKKQVHNIVCEKDEMYEIVDKIINKGI